MSTPHPFSSPTMLIPCSIWMHFLVNREIIMADNLVKKNAINIFLLFFKQFYFFFKCLQWAMEASRFKEEQYIYLCSKFVLIQVKLQFQIILTTLVN